MFKLPEFDIFSMSLLLNFVPSIGFAGVVTILFLRASFVAAELLIYPLEYFGLIFPF